MKTIFSYDDFRLFLRDHYAEKKSQSKSYSFRFFARKAGLNSPNYYKLVMDGERNLTHSNVRKFAKGLGLGEKEELYFQNLVLLNQSKEVEEKEFFKKNLEMIRSADDRVLLTPDQYQIIAHWYPLAIKELLLVEGAEQTPKKIATRFDHQFTPQQAREALDLLERLRLVKIDPKDGKIKPTHEHFQTPDLAKSDAVTHFHKNALNMAKEALDHQSSSERCFSSLVVAIRKEDLPEAFKRIHQFRNELDNFLTRRKPFNAVYQLNLNLFRLDIDGE